MTTAVEIARQQWAEGYRKLEAERSNLPRYRLLHTQVEAVTEQLRRRLGGIFTLAELADTYQGADAWVRDAVTDWAPQADWPPGFSTSSDAAFHLFARGARDYQP